MLVRVYAAHKISRSCSFKELNASCPFSDFLLNILAFHVHGIVHFISKAVFSQIVRALRDKNRSRANCVPIYGDLYQSLYWSLTFDLKVVTHLKSASEASYDVINMATIMRNCSLIKAMVCVGMVIFIQHERFF